MATDLNGFKVAQRSFSKKPQTKDLLQMALDLGFNESSNTKIANYSYLRLFLNVNYVGWEKVKVLRDYSIACGYRRSCQIQCWRNNKAQII